MSEIRAPRGESGSGWEIALTIALGLVLVIMIPVIENYKSELKDARDKIQLLENEKKAVQKQLDSMTGKDIQSASLIVGRDGDVNTPFGKLRVSAQFLDRRTEYDARIAVSAKFLDKGYSLSVPTDGTWHTRSTGWQYRISPQGYSVGYEWNKDKDGNPTTLKNSWQFYTLEWRPKPHDSYDWTYGNQAMEKQASVEASSQ